MQDIINIPPFQDFLITLDLRPLYLLPVLSSNSPIPESCLKQITRIPTWYQRFVLVDSNYTKKYEQRSEIVPKTYIKAFYICRCNTLENNYRWRI